MPQESNSDDVVSINNAGPAEIEAQKAKEKFIESNAGDGTMIFDQYLTGMPLYLCFLACFVSMFLIGLDQTIVSTILTKVGTEFNDYSNIGWVTSGYMLTMAIFSQTWGRLSIIFGRKYSLLTGIVLFEAGSLVSALSKNMNTLIGGRVLSGVGGGGVQTLVFIVVSELVPINKRPVAFSSLFGFMSLATVTGPLIGGAFTDNVTWRWCFYINLPLGGLAMVALVFFYHPPMPKFTWREKVRMVDYVGAFLLAVGCVLFLLALSLGGVTYPWKSGAVISMFILGPLVLAVFGYWNVRHSVSPIIPPSIVTSYNVMVPITILFFAFFYFLGLIVYMSTYFQIVRGETAIHTGLQFLPFIIALVVFSLISGILMRRTRHIKPFPIIGSIIAPLASGLCVLLGPDVSSSANIGYMILPGVAMGLTLQSSTIATQMHAPKEEGSMILVTALSNFSRALGGAIGGDLAQVVYNSSLKTKGTSMYHAHLDLFTGLTLDQVLGYLNDPVLISSMPADMKKVMLDCVMGAIRNVFYMCTAAGGITLIFSLLMSSKMIPKEEDMKTKEEYEKDNGEKETEKLEDEDEAQVSVTNSEQQS